MTKIKGWVVVTDFKKKARVVPVEQKFFMAKACAECLRNEMNLKKSLNPETYIYPYKIVKGTLILED